MKTALLTILSLSGIGLLASCGQNVTGTDSKKSPSAQVKSIANMETGYYLIAIKQDEDSWIVNAYSPDGTFQQQITPRPLSEVELRRALRTTSHWTHTGSMLLFIPTGGAALFLSPIAEILEGESLVTAIQTMLSLPLTYWGGERIHRNARVDALKALKDRRNLIFSPRKFDLMVERLQNPGA